MANNAQLIWDYLVKQGFSKSGVGAIMGNLQAESGLEPNNLQNSYNQSLSMSDVQYTAAVDNKTYTNFINDSAGYGLAQWTYYSRKEALQNYAISQGKSIGNLNLQLKFLVKELKESFSSLYNELKTTTSLEDATKHFMTQYEMPYDQSQSALNIRINYAKSFYNKFVSAESSSATEDSEQILTLKHLISTNTLLQRGSTGNSVKVLQKCLIDLGFSCGEDGADGEYGANTFKAVVSFQTKHKLEVDGIAGPETYQKLIDELGLNTSSTTTSVVSVKQGDTGSTVKKIQEKLIELGYSCGPDGADGDFGDNTKSAVISFQMDNGLSATGIVDTLTYTKLQTTTQAKTIIIDTSSNETAINSLLEIARAQIGYHEKNSNMNLDNNTANSGSGNWTKYARDLANAGYYNGNKNGYAWCDVFTDWCFWKLTGGNTKLAQQIECQTGDCGAGCIYSAQYYRNSGRYSSTPQVGDQIFFGATGSEYHTGIVEQVTSTQVITIEGNTSDQVARRTYAINSSEINGYGHPYFNLLTNNTITVEQESSTIKVKITANVLNIRNGAGTDYTAIGVYTLGTICEILEISNNWGRTEKGWICLDYAQEVEE